MIFLSVSLRQRCHRAEINFLKTRLSFARLDFSPSVDLA